MAAKRTPIPVTVLSSTQLTANMLRLTLHGEDLASFPPDAEGAYFKLLFEDANTNKTIKRTYTVSKFRREAHEMDVDFMLHGNANSEGVAAPWAMQAKVGNSITIFAPKSAAAINMQADWFLLAADMTALPALTANLALLPESAKGYVVIEILSEEDKQDLTIPVNMEVLWVINPHAGSDDSPLYEAIKQIPWPEGRGTIWSACEFKTMKKLRQYYSKERAVPGSHLYISSYWKQGLKEEEHKIVKRADVPVSTLARKAVTRIKRIIKG